VPASVTPRHSLIEGSHEQFKEASRLRRRSKQPNHDKEQTDGEDTPSSTERPQPGDRLAAEEREGLQRILRAIGRAKVRLSRPEVERLAAELEKEENDDKEDKEASHEGDR
jgi:hypothetical protein